MPPSPKERMVDMVVNKTDTRHPIRKKILSNLTNIAELKIKDFVTKKLEDLFQILNVPLQFLNNDPSICKENDNIHVTRKVVIHIKPLNEFAKKAVVLMHEFNTSLIQEKQFILKVIKIYCYAYSKLSKKDFIEI